MSRQFVIRVSDEEGEAIEKLAESTGDTYTEIMRSALREYLHTSEAPQSFFSKLTGKKLPQTEDLNPKDCKHLPSRRIFLNGNMICDMCGSQL